jgi:MFS family permease
MQARRRPDPHRGPAFVLSEGYRLDVAGGGVGLGEILRVRGFRLLLGTRLVGQAGDGLLESGLAAFVLFSPTSQPTPAKAAFAFSILLLPYSLIGPFAGVLIDRWRRRSVLLVANVLRAAWVAVLALIVARGHDDLLLAGWVLGLLGVNRFILAALSAGLPHVVAGRYLVTGNALAPTAGTVAWIVGGLGGLLLRHAVGGGDTGAVIVLVTTVPVYLLAGAVASRLAPDELGPDDDSARESIRSIASGLVAGVHHLAERRPAARAIGLVTVHRAIFGAATLLTVLQARETLYPGDPDGAIAAIGITSLAAGAGALLGALVTPWMARRLGPVPWSVGTLVVGVALGSIGIAMPSLAGFVVRGLFLGFAGQAVKVCSDTIVQEDVEDTHRGRVFSWYDVAVNVGIVTGVVMTTLALSTETSTAVMAVVMTTVAVAAGVWATVREARDPAVRYAEDPAALAHGG